MACHCALKGDLGQKVDHTSFAMQFRGGGGVGKGLANVPMSSTDF